VTGEAELVEEDLSPWRQADLRARSRRRRMLLGVVIAFTVLTALFGFPTGREVITFWLLLTLLAACSGNLSVWRRAVVRDWLPLLAVLWAYDLLRGVANEVGGYLFGLQRYCSADTLELCRQAGAQSARAHLTEPIAVDSWLFGGTVPTVWLQEHLFDPGTAHWYDTLVIPVYMSHFLVSLLVAVVLWCTHYRLFRKYIAVLVVLTLAAVTTYLLYPMAPPWMAAVNPPNLGGVEIHRVVQETITTLGGSQLGSKVERGAAYSNRVAAMPSLHAAIPMMLLLFFWGSARLRGRVLLVSYAVGMAFALVYGGEHYVIDVVMGWVYAAVVVLGLRAWWARRSPDG
jgi:membrane-associated phospholipid phosphatase